jgi:rSAM/selenodomain-associated transferase 2
MTRLSVVIPTLNAAATLPATLDCLRGVGEVIVADGGSHDATRRLAEDWGARVLDAPSGRGPQLAAGAKEARGDWLLFLHADTRLAAGWRAAVDAHIAEKAERAAYFRLHLDDEARAARRIERLAAWRARRFGLPYGDQALLVPAPLYRALGGHRPVPLMEDVDLVRRIGRARLVELPVGAITSASRYRRDGWIARPVRNLTCLTLWFAGVPPRLIARLYA